MSFEHGVLFAWGGNIGGYMDSSGSRLLTADEFENARTREQYPYSYDPFLIFEKRTKKKEAEITANGTIYTDRLLQWDYAKHDLLCKKHFGNTKQYWEDRPSSKIEAFLRDWVSDPDLVLCRVVQYCNQATGFPTWRLDYHSADKAS